MLQKSMDHAMPQPALSLPPLAASATRSLISAQRSLQGLAAVLEILEADHLNHHDGAAEPLLGSHLVDGLLVAGRQLAASARAALDPA